MRQYNLYEIHLDYTPIHLLTNYFVGICRVFRQQAMNKKTITIARNIQSADASISQAPHKKHKKSSSVYPHSSPSVTPPATFSQTHEKSYGVPVDTYSGFDIEEGRQPTESGSSPCHEPRRRPKFFLLSILIIIALLITGAAIAAIVVLLGANDQVESNDSAAAKKEPSEDMVVHETISTNVSLVLCYFLVPFDRLGINQSYSHVFDFLDCNK